MNDTVTKQVDTADLEARVKSMYELVALEPDQTFHFETDRGPTEHLGYPAAAVDTIPAEAPCAGGPCVRRRRG
jgi:arsenite methyltransferase